MRAGFACVVGLLPLAFAAAAVAAPQDYATPEVAVEAVVAALEARDRDALVAVFGAENEDVVFTGDPVQDRAIGGEFLGAYRVLNRLTEGDDGSETLEIGRDLWPFPAPLVEGADGWHFDMASARDEVLMRRIGENELDTIELMRGYVAAQAAYRALDPDGDGVRSFAANLLSSTDRRDGLYWPDAEGAPESPVGDFLARASAEGYSFDGGDEEPVPYHGYYFRILTKQRPSAPGGAFDYMVGDRLLAGHALLAFPAAYGDSGVMSFLVAEAGQVYEADLGPDTLERAAAIDSFDPGEGWTPVPDDAAAE